MSCTSYFSYCIFHRKARDSRGQLYLLGVMQSINVPGSLTPINEQIFWSSAFGWVTKSSYLNSSHAFIVNDGFKCLPFFFSGYPQALVHSSTIKGTVTITCLMPSFYFYMKYSTNQRRISKFVVAEPDQNTVCPWQLYEILHKSKAYFKLRCGQSRNKIRSARGSYTKTSCYLYSG